MQQNWTSIAYDKKAKITENLTGMIVFFESAGKLRIIDSTVSSNTWLFTKPNFFIDSACSLRDT